AIATSATLSDLSGENHTALWSWGDNTTSAGTFAQNGSTVTGSHTYVAAGVYTVTLTVTNTDHHSGQATYQYVVIYDPRAGFVTGGGWLTSPAGAYLANPALTGKATFGFSVKYQSGTTTPVGSTEFQFPSANLSFHATGYDWLVLSGSQA